MVEPQTVIQIFWQRAEKSPDGTAVLLKSNGAYKPISWGEQAGKVGAIAAALLSFGVKKQDKVAIMSASCAKWTWADLAVLSVSAVTVPIYPSLNSEEMEYLLQHSEAVGLFVDNKSQLKKILSLSRIPPELRFIVCFDQGLADVSLSMPIHSFDKLLVDFCGKDDHRVKEIVLAIKPDDLATIVYTSGTTGVPKGAMIKHSNIYFICKSLSTAIGFTPDDLALSFLPLSHIFERVGGQFMAIYQGLSLAYAESMESVATNIVEVRPTMMNAVPRFYEKVYSRIQGQIRLLPKAQQYLARWALSIGKRAVREKEQSKNGKKEMAGRIYRTELRVADRLVFRKIRQRFGGRLRFLASGAAPLSFEVQQFFEIIGLPILEGYGLTETTAPVACNRPADNRSGTVGKPLAGVDVKIAADGEILVRGPSIFSGYYKNPEATKEAFCDGWFLTGDIGDLDADGYLRIKDRKKDIIITAGGKHIAPQLMENLLAGQGLISRALIYGDRRKYVAALITLNQDELKSFAQRHGIEYSGLVELTHHSQVVAEVEKTIQALNLKLASFEQIKRFLILDNDFSIDAGELTPTLKLKRKVVTQKYKNLLDSLYDQEEIQLEKASQT